MDMAGFDEVILETVGVGQDEVDVVQAAALDSQTVTFNGVANPANDLSDAPAAALENPGNSFSYTFAPYSVTLIRLMP